MDKLPVAGDEHSIPLVVDVDGSLVNSPRVRFAAIRSLESGKMVNVDKTRI